METTSLLDFIDTIKEHRFCRICFDTYEGLYIWLFGAEIKTETVRKYNGLINEYYDEDIILLKCRQIIVFDSEDDYYNHKYEGVGLDYRSTPIFINEEDLGVVTRDKDGYYRIPVDYADVIDFKCFSTGDEIVGDLVEIIKKSITTFYGISLDRSNKYLCVEYNIQHTFNFEIRVFKNENLDSGCVKILILNYDSPKVISDKTYNKTILIGEIDGSESYKSLNQCDINRINNKRDNVFNQLREKIKNTLIISTDLDRGKSISKTRKLLKLK